MTSKPVDRICDSDREYVVLHGESSLLNLRKHGMTPVRGLSGVSSRGVSRRYRIRADGALVLDQLQVDLADLHSAPALFGIRPSFPTWQSKDGPQGTARYDFLPDGVDHMEAPVTLIVGDDYDANVHRALFPAKAPSGMRTLAAAVFPYRIVHELRFERGPIEDESANHTFRSSPKVGIRLATTIDHAPALNAIRHRLGPPNGVEWLKRLALEASEHLGSRFHVRPEDFSRNPHEELQRMAAEIDALEREAKGGG